MSDAMPASLGEVASPRLVRLESYRRAIALARGNEEVLDELFRRLGRGDLFFLLVFILCGDFANNDWVFDRCVEFQKDPDGRLDLWPREHFKSTIITLGAVVQAIINDPELTVGIFSFNRPIAKQFLRQIKWHFESNQKLRRLFKDILWDDPGKEAPKWSEDDGIIIRRQGFPKEATVEAWGLVDGMPTSKHYGLMVYDDIVTVDSVRTPEMSKKVTEAVAISFNLGKEGGRRWMLGTRYHFADTYAELIRRQAVILRAYAATKDGKFDGEPWFLTRERLAEKIRDMGVYVASCQLFNNPVMEGEETFKEEWLERWKVKGRESWGRMNRYILVDPAGEKKKDSDYTVMWVFGLGADKNFYTIEFVRDKLSLSERAEMLLKLHALYKPLKVGYEKYGMQADIEYVKILQEQKQYRFPITQLGGQVPKNDRIRRLQPIFEAHRFYLPDRLVRVDYRGNAVDLVDSFITEEYLQFPYMVHDDMLDCASRIMDEDMKVSFPKEGALDASGNFRYEPIETGEAYEVDTYAYLRRGK